jgi:hypothetical protein
MRFRREHPVESFRRSEEGWVTPLSLQAFVVMAVIGGLALDLSRLVAARTQLQVAADIAAHAALYNRDLLNGTDPNAAGTAKDLAIALARDSMPTARFGEYITADDIEFGTFDGATRTFTPDPDALQAARVVAFRVSERANTVGSVLLRLAGIFEFDVVTSAVFETYRPTCFREGFVADGVVDIQSNNSFTNGFCIHSNQHVSVNQNNYYEPGTVVSMPHTGDLDMPQSGFEKNEGLEEALRPGKYSLLILNRLEDMLDGMTDERSRYYRADYVSDPVPHTVTRKTKMTPADFEANRVNVMSCGGQRVTLEAETFSNMVIIGYDCRFSMSNGTALENMTLFTTSTDTRSIDSPQGFRMGVDDDCGDSGGAQIVTWGGVRVAANLEMYGSQIIAAGPIDFAANASGIKGASMVSGATIDGTSNMSFGFCGTGMQNNFEAEYFRLRA